MKERMMHHLADALRNFRSKLYKHFILPNISKPSKLKVVPKQHRNVEQADWNKFVEYTLSDQFKVIYCINNAIFIGIFYIFHYTIILISFFLVSKGISESAKASRAKHKYPHRLGRSGYEGLTEKMVMIFLNC